VRGRAQAKERGECVRKHFIGGISIVRAEKERLAEHWAAAAITKSEAFALTEID
jgi:hypothetical protein